MEAAPASSDAAWIAVTTGSLALIGIILTLWQGRSTRRLAQRTHDTVNSVEAEVDHRNGVTLGQRAQNMDRKLDGFISDNRIAQRLLTDTLHTHGNQIEVLSGEVQVVVVKLDEVAAEAAAAAVKADAAAAVIARHDEWEKQVMAPAIKALTEGNQ